MKITYLDAPVSLAELVLKPVTAVKVLTLLPGDTEICQ